MYKGIKFFCRVGFYVMIAWLVVACLMALVLPTEARAEEAERLILPPAVGLFVFGGINAWIYYRLQPHQMRKSHSSEKHVDLRRWEQLFILCAVGLFAISLSLLYLIGWVLRFESTESMMQAAVIFIVWLICFILLASLQGHIVKKMRGVHQGGQLLILKLLNFPKRELDESEVRVVHRAAFRTRSLMTWIFFISILISLYFGQLFAFLVLAAIWMVHFGHFHYVILKQKN
ncbi:DUF3169 family protein [Novibacillus thermophilus]|uniref:DUF3169 domain-containing protein n=1 Tax=Novibacillus thermophilus TaxID=1471761 RepID=A0A1U9K902_9BACL|nr:DUF3169 family protein [Novibacillus thermophilus]AQS56549.1 hypothetical protein B0W44_13045 [Novibacillus thermophilus]